MKLRQFLLLLITGTSFLLAGELGKKASLTGGWYFWDPYQFNASSSSGFVALEGLDIKLTEIIAKYAGKNVDNNKYIEWGDHVQALKDGTCDIAAGATWTEERSEFVHFTEPYRFEENALYVLRDKLSDWDNVHNVDDMLEYFDSHTMKVAIIKGYAYADSKINKWVKDPENQNKIIYVYNEQDNIEVLLDKRVDCYIGDRIAAATTIWKKKKGSLIAEKNLGIKVPIHLMLSKKTVSATMLEEFNQAIKEVKGSDEYKAVIKEYFYPVILLQTVDTWWFWMLDYLGTFAFAMSGLIIAYRERVTIFAAFIFSILPSVGGSLVRDVILQRQPIGMLQSPIYVAMVVAMLILGFIGIRIFTHTPAIINYFSRSDRKEKYKHFANQTIMFFDALGLAAFTVSGIIVCVVMKAEPLWLWGPFFAFLTGAGGGIMRDLLTRERSISAFDKSAIFPEVPALWGLFLSIFLTMHSSNLEAEPIKYAVILTVIGAFLTRVLIYRLNIQNIIFGSYQSPKK